MKGGSLGAAIAHFDPNQNVVRIGLGVLNLHIEVAIVVENPGVRELELGLVFTPAAILVDNPLVWVFRLRILIEAFHV